MPAFAPRAAASAEAGTKLSANSSSPAESPEDAIVFRPFEEVRSMNIWARTSERVHWSQYMLLLRSFTERVA